MKYIRIITVLTLISNSIISFPVSSFASYHFGNFVARPPIHINVGALPKPTGLTPAQVKSAYNLPATGGQGTIALITAYNDVNIESDLAVFNKEFKLAPCTIANKCLEKHPMDTGITTDKNWALETSLDVQWTHAIAPNAKILIVSAKTPSGTNMLKAIDYARSRKDVVAVSMSWGGAEFAEETTLDSHFQSTGNHVQFFAASGDTGTGASWPAASPNVIAVGGTTFAFGKDTPPKETGWSGSGGGISVYEKQPLYQKTFGVPRANGMRAIPDVSYVADPKNGFPIYYSSSSKNGAWYTAGGTSASAPQWAAIHALGLSVTHAKIYADKSDKKSELYFRDIKSGSNGTCTYYCDARTHYDYVTGLGSPLTIHF